MIYQKDSSKAEEFIPHEEILDTLEYAKNNKDNRALIEQLIEKASHCKGLSHCEAALLLECNQPDLIERIFHLAKEIKQKFYGNRIVMFAPLYLSNYCVNGSTNKKDMVLYKNQCADACEFNSECARSRIECSCI